MSDDPKRALDTEPTPETGECNAQHASSQVGPSHAQLEEAIRSVKTTSPDSPATVESIIEPGDTKPLAEGVGQPSIETPPADQENTQATGDEPAVPAPATVYTPPKPATWGVKEPEEPWCPAAIEIDLGSTQRYEHEVRYASDFGDGWKVAAASKRGRMHAHHGTFREDALWGSMGKLFSFSVVCDGAGSSKLSRIGSEYTARTLSQLIENELNNHEADLAKCSKESLPANLRTILHHCLDSVSRSLISIAEKSGTAPKDFRCTVLTALHYRHSTGGILLFANVGDGFIGVKRKGKAAERVGTSDSGAFSGEVTCFMPDPPICEFYKKSLEENTPIPDEEIEAYILCTDGIEDPFFPIHRNVDAIFTQLTNGYSDPLQDVSYPTGQEPTSVVRSEKPGEELLKWLSFEKRGENDDRTIALIYRKELSLAQNEEIPLKSEHLSEALVRDRQENESINQSYLSKLSHLNLWPMIVGGILILGALLIGILIGLKMGGAPKTLTLPGT